jgi:hypothetical protein
LVILIILEIFSFVAVDRDKVEDIQYIIKKDISLNTFIDELQKNEMDIVNMNRKSSGYEFKILVMGSTEEVKNKVKELDEFNISSYELEVKDKLIKGTLTISTIS